MSVAGFLLFALALVFYLLPTVIANTRETEHRGAIFLINLLFGWTVLGWIAALIWAIVEKPKITHDKLNGEATPETLRRLDPL